MARQFTGQQKKIVNRYYEHRETILLTRLQQTVSDIYLAIGTPKEKTLWKSAEKALRQLDPDPARAEKILADRDLNALAKRVGELQLIPRNDDKRRG